MTVVGGAFLRSKAKENWLFLSFWLKAAPKMVNMAVGSDVMGCIDGSNRRRAIFLPFHSK